MNLHMPGTLVRYGPKQAHTAFVSGRHDRHLILAGGLGDGLMLADFVPVLAKQLDSISWCLVQPLLSSSLSGWGIGSLDEDASELALLARFLMNEMGSQDFVLCGHSTGCQDAVRYMNCWPQHSREATERGIVHYPQPAGVILQAPVDVHPFGIAPIRHCNVSDRDWLAQQPDTEQRLECCSEMLRAGRGEDIAFRDDGVPMTARRFHSLAAPDGDDNMFSTVLDGERLKEILGAVTLTPTLWLFSGEDEFVPAGMNKEAHCMMYASVLTHRPSRCQIVEGAPHSLTGYEDEAVQIMIDFVKSL